MSYTAKIIALLAFVIGGLCTNALADGSQIELVESSIDYPSNKAPARVVGTAVFDINDLGNLSIQVTLEDGSIWVGTRINGRYGTLSQPPDTDQEAVAEDLNNLNVVIGSFLDLSSNKFRGFFLTNGTYTVFDVKASSATSTAPIGINDYGVISGFYGTSTGDQAFRQFGQKETDLDVHGAVGTAGSGTNDLLQTAGYFSTSDPTLNLATCCQSVVWNETGHPTTFAVTGATSTVALGINNLGWVCGRYFDTVGGGVHGFVYNLNTGQLLTYDHPEATQTTFNGINDPGYISGRYTDSGGTEHGFIAQIAGK
jgi:hypothetical protein